MKIHPRLAGLATVLSIALASSLSAQELKVTPSDVLIEGQTADIQYSDPSRAGQTITVVITSNGIFPEQVSLQITLNSQGEGSTTWTVESWSGANFTAPGVSSISIPIRAS